MRQFFCVGTYTEPILFGTGEVFTGKGKGVYLCAFEEGDITTLSVLAQQNPSFLCIQEQYKKLYAVNELKEYMGGSGGGVTEIAFTPQGELKALQTFQTGGTDPCHVALSPDGKLLAVSNFASGSVAVFSLDANGELLPGKQFFQHHGNSTHAIRQKGPHAHSAIFCDEDGRMLVPDLGIDQLVCYTTQGAAVVQDGTVKLPAGSGPRFGEFSADCRHFYLINEISSSIAHFRYEAGHMQPMQTYPTLPDDFAGDNICSDLHIAPNGEYLYASNRGHDSIVVFAIAQDGGLIFLERIPCGGRTPRNFAIDPTGAYMLVGNQDTDTIAVFQIQKNGRLRFLKTIDFPTPVCIRFFHNTIFDC